MYICMYQYYIQLQVRIYDLSSLDMHIYVHMSMTVNGIRFN